MSLRSLSLSKGRKAEGGGFLNGLNRDHSPIFPGNPIGIPLGVQQFQRVGNENTGTPEDQPSTTDAGIRGKVATDFNAYHENRQDRER